MIEDRIAALTQAIEKIPPLTKAVEDLTSTLHAFARGAGCLNQTTSAPVATVAPLTELPPQSAPAAQSEAPKRGRKSKVETPPPAAAPAEPATTPETPATPAATSAAKSEITINDLRAIAEQLMDLKATDRIRPAVEKTAGVMRISDVPPEKYADALAALQAALAEVSGPTLADLRTCVEHLKGCGAVDRVAPALKAAFGVSTIEEVPADKIAAAKSLLDSVWNEASAEDLKRDEARQADAKSVAAQRVKAATDAPATTPVTLDQVKNLAIAIRDAGGAEKIRAIAKKWNAERITLIPATAYAEAFALLNEAAAEFKTAA